MITNDSKPNTGNFRSDAEGATEPNRTVLAVTHEASRTGAVRAFVTALPALAMTSHLTVVSKKPGPMISEMRGTRSKVLIEPHRFRGRLRSAARIRRLEFIAPRIEANIASSVVRYAKPDMVYASTVLSSEYISAAREHCVPSVLHVHEQQPLISWALDRSGVDPADLRVIVPSDFVAKEMEMIGATVVGILPGPLEVASVTTAIDEVFPWSDTSYKVLGCGSIAEWKGCDVFLDLAEALPAINGRPVDYVWVGAGDLESIRHATTERGLAERVTWVGERPNARPFMVAADLLVVPSRREPLGLVALEAAAAHTPTIAYEVGGLGQILNDPRALAKPEDLRDLTGKVSAALTDSALRNTLLVASSAAVSGAEAASWQSALGLMLTRL